LGLFGAGNIARFEKNLTLVILLVFRMKLEKYEFPFVEAGGNEEYPLAEAQNSGNR
jgi:hypothetical protein